MSFTPLQKKEVLKRPTGIMSKETRKADEIFLAFFSKMLHTF